MVSSILTQAGLRTGLYTSPHLWTFHERFQVDGAPISDAMLGELGELVIKAGEGLEDPPTEFELMTALGLEFFLRMKCDIVVLEVGLGGRLDSTNVIPAPEAAVITNIGLEHTQELGNSRTLIAQEKSGIIKKGCSTVQLLPTLPNNSAIAFLLPSRSKGFIRLYSYSRLTVLSRSAASSGSPG